MISVMAALSFIAYEFFRIPNVFGTGASFHLGNTFTALTALLLDGVSGGLAGAIGLSMAAGCRQLIGGEIVPEAVESARRNAAAMGLTNIRFLCGDAAKIAGTLIRDSIRPTLIILDPPRKGCSPETLQAVLTLNPDRIVMVSCDPATAARDCRILSDHGYTLTRLRPVDLFPRTKHVETVCLLTHNG